MIKIIGTVVSIISAGLGVKYPQYSMQFISASTFILGWLHVPQPK